MFQTDDDVKNRGKELEKVKKKKKRTDCQARAQFVLFGSTKPKALRMSHGRHGLSRRAPMDFPARPESPPLSDCIASYDDKD